MLNSWHYYSLPAEYITSLPCHFHILPNCWTTFVNAKSIWMYPHFHWESRDLKLCSMCFLVTFQWNLVQHKGTLKFHEQLVSSKLTSVLLFNRVLLLFDWGMGDKEWERRGTCVFNPTKWETFTFLINLCRALYNKLLVMYNHYYFDYEHADIKINVIKCPAYWIVMVHVFRFLD